MARGFIAAIGVAHAGCETVCASTWKDHGDGMAPFEIDLDDKPPSGCARPSPAFSLWPMLSGCVVYMFSTACRP